MIYLIESSTYYKIGYAKDVNKRMKAYNTHNPDFKLIDTLEGTKEVENTLHKLCKNYQVKSEWFHKKEEVLLIWDTYKKFSEYLNKTISENSKKIKEIGTQIEAVEADRKSVEKLINIQQKLIDQYQQFLENLLAVANMNLPSEIIVQKFKMYLNNQCRKSSK